MARFKIFFGQVPTGPPPVIVYQRPDGDVALDGWTDHADGTSDIYQALDETTASDSDFVQSPAVVVDEGGTITIGTPPGGEGNLGYPGADKSAQNFISVGPLVSSIRLWLMKTGSPTFNVTVKICTVDASHHPLTQVGVTSNTLVSSSFTMSLAPYDFTFSPPISVANGGEYAFLIEINAAPSSVNYVRIGYSGGGVDYGGTTYCWHYFNGTAWLIEDGYDLVSVIDQTQEAAPVDINVRLFDGSTQIVEWTHTDIADTFADATQTLTAPELAAITDFSNLFAELDDNQGNVYRFALGDPAGGVSAPVRVKYRYKKLAA